ncbi:MAG: hypothetical protein WCW27_06470 [Patescibacteria group bacterium]|jgi:hypothetical protein
MEQPNNPLANSEQTNPIVDHLEQDMANLLNKDGLNIRLPKAAMLSVLKKALGQVKLTPENITKLENAHVQLAVINKIALADLANRVANGMGESLDEAPPAGVTEAVQALPNQFNSFGNMPDNLPTMAMPATSRPPTNLAHQTQPRPSNDMAMPGEGVGDDEPTPNKPAAGQQATTQPTQPANAPANFPGLNAPSAQPVMPTAQPGADSSFPYQGTPEQQKQAEPPFAQNALANQDAQPTPPPTAGSPTPAGATNTPPPGTPPPAAGAPGTPNNQPAGATSNAANPATQPQAQTGGQPTAGTTPNNNTATQKKTKQVGPIGNLFNRIHRRGKINAVNTKIKDTQNKLKDVSFQFATEYFVIVCFKELLDFLMTLLDATGFMIIICTAISAACGSVIGLIIWWQTKTWKKEVFNNKIALQAIVAFLLELIPIIQLLPLNIAMAYALTIQTERRKKHHENKLDKLQKEKHKLINQKKI